MSQPLCYDFLPLASHALVRSITTRIHTMADTSADRRHEVVLDYPNEAHPPKRPRDDRAPMLHISGGGAAAKRRKTENKTARSRMKPFPLSIVSSDYGHASHDADCFVSHLLDAVRLNNTRHDLQQTLTKLEAEYADHNRNINTWSGQREIIS